MSLKPTEWFIDTFPSIMGLSADADESVATSDSSEAAVSNGTVWSKIMEEECDGDEQLVRMCEKYCLVNNCKYTTGIAAIVVPVSGILPFESPHVLEHMQALGGFKSRFCFAGNLETQQRSYSSILKSALSGNFSSNAQSTTVWDNCTKSMLIALLRYHRPNTCDMVERIFGSNQLPNGVLKWLSSGFLGTCDGAGTARELMASIAATGEPATVALLAIAALDDIVSSSVVLTSEAAVKEAIDSFSFSPETLCRTWMSASEMASLTPVSFGDEYCLFATASGRSKLSTSSQPVLEELSILYVPPRDVIEDLISNVRTRPEANDISENTDSSVAYSIGDDSKQRLVLSMECMAGVSIETSLRPFMYVNEHIDAAETLPRDVVYIDARTEEERLKDESETIVLGSRVASPARQTSKDWFSASAESVESPRTIASDRTAGGLAIHKLKRALWVDSDIDLETDLDATELGGLFLKKLEFYRGYRICIIGESSTANRLTKILITKEFPYISRLRGGFGALAQALTSLEDVSKDIICKIAIIEERQVLVPTIVPDTDKNGLKMFSNISSAWKEQSSNISSYVHGIDTKDLKSRFSSMFRRTRTTNRTPPPKSPPPIVVAPSPIVIGKLLGPRVEATFEIGGEEEDHIEFGIPPGSSSPIHDGSDDFSSVDFSEKT